MLFKDSIEELNVIGFCLRETMSELFSLCSFRVPFFFPVPCKGTCTKRRASIGAVKQDFAGSGLPKWLGSMVESVWLSQKHKALQCQIGTNNS